MTTSVIVGDLLSKGLLVETDESTTTASKGGRPPVYLTLNSQTKFLIGVDIGTTTISLVLGNLKGQILDRHRLPTNRSRDVESILGQVEQLVVTLLNKASVPISKVIGIGVSVAGLVDKQRGRVKFSPDFNWKDVPFRAQLEEKIKLPVVIDNCTRVATLGEMWYGAAKGSRSLFYVNVGYGIGSAIVTDGNVYQHTSEFGHITATNSTVKCECGKNGCLEAVSSGRALERAANRLMTDKFGEGWITAKDLFGMALQGNQKAKDIFEEAGGHLGRAISTVANILSPDVIIIGGGVSRGGDLLMDPIRREFDLHTMEAIKENTTVCISSLGMDASVIGAMTLALNTFVFHQSTFERK